MRKRGLQHRLGRRLAVEPLEEPSHLLFEPVGDWCLEVHAFAADRTGHDLHRRRTVVTPGAHRDSMHPAPASREQRRVPAEEAVRRQQLVVVLRRVQHHLDDAFDVTVRRLQTADIDPQPTRDRRPDLVRVQPLAFDLAALQHVFGERAENGLLFDPEAERLHLADQAPLEVPGCRQRSRQPAVIPPELGPVRELMDINGSVHSPHYVR